PHQTIMKLFLETKDFSISGEPFELHWDENLDMLVTHPQPEDIARYYESEDYISHTDAQKSFTDTLYHVVKQTTRRNKIQLIENQNNNNNSLLDIGAGTGDFLMFAKSKGYEVAGVEPNDKARQLASRKGVDLKPELESFSNEKFQTITLWHVLEHLPHLE